MSETTISVTEAARNFAECVKRVHEQRHVFVLLKRGVPVARLVPAEKLTCRGRELAVALAGVKLSPADARGWQRDLRTARQKLKIPCDK